MKHYYKIEINLNSENADAVNKYFWCITDNTITYSCNNGHGWSNSVENAAKDAYLYYLKNILLIKKDK